ncbi:MAG: C-GCAxxG-C-C family protein [Proteobacteria bacterium]|nr:C-GCAxxG-C-C family protein [Pseudomonadota bacterium]MBU1742938.1 C-GCAxxG-C-C family protein [Pseudomonadota bacterium]
MAHDQAALRPTGCRACGPGQTSGAEPNQAATSPGTARSAPPPEIDAPEIKRRAYAHFTSGRLCAEVMVATVLETFGETDYGSLVKAASGLSGGIAGSTEELCGAFTGGVLAIGSFLGRERPGDEMRDLGVTILDFKEKFAEKFGSLNCGTILDGLQDQGPHLGCARMTAAAAVMVAEILREQTGKIDLQTIARRPRPKVALGTCPFSAGN